MDLRPYQQEAKQAILRELETVDSTLLVLPTGTGKTIVFSMVIDQYLTNHGGRALVLAHREELLGQAIDKIETCTSRTVQLEQADHFVSRLAIPQIVVASKDSLQGNRLRGFDPATFSLIVTDEAHHAPAKTYRNIYDHFSHAKHLGVTATPDRTDRKALGAVFKSVAYVYDIRDAIEQGYLVKLIFQRVLVDDLDLSRVRTVAGDFVEADLEEQFTKEKVLHEVADPLVRLSDGRPTLFFSPGVRHAYALADVLNGYRSQSADAIDGKLDSSDRERRMRDFREGRLQFLGNCSIMTEGVDIPHVSCIGNCRPTKSRSLYSQIIGRSTRLHPGKENALILDFTDASQMHSLISPVDIMDGNMDEEVKARAEKLCQKGISVLDAMARAEEELAEEERQRELKRRQKLVAQTTYRTLPVNPLDIIGVHPREGRWGGAPITPKQIAILKQHGMPWKGLDCGQAEQVIDRLMWRTDKGFCPVGVATKLAEYGLNPDVPMAVGIKQLNMIAAYKCRITDDVRAQIQAMAA